jgi:hypothetical protein
MAIGNESLFWLVFVAMGRRCRLLLSTTGKLACNQAGLKTLKLENTKFFLLTHPPDARITTLD